MSFSFRDLTLNNVQVQSSGGLKPGRYVAEVTEAKIEKTRTGGSQCIVQLRDLNGAGSIRDYINLFTPNSEQAGKIGLERLKALLVYGGHRDPDNIGKYGVESMKGLRVGIAIDEEEYEKDGKILKGSRLKRSGAYFDPAELGFPNAKSDGGGVGDMKDDIPF